MIILLQYLPWSIRCSFRRLYFSKRIVSSYFPMCPEGPWGLGFLYRLRRLCFLVGPLCPWSLEIPGGLEDLVFLYRLRRLWLLLGPLGRWSLAAPMSLEVPWGPGGLHFLVSLRRLCLNVVPWILAGRVIPKCLLVPRVQGFPAYLGFLARKSRHHNREVRMVETGECPKCTEQTRLILSWSIDMIFL